MSSETPSLVELAGQIQQNASSLQELLESHGYAQPKLGTDSIQTYPTPAENEAIAKTRMALIEASRTMLDFALGPTDSLKTIVSPDHAFTADLHIVQHFDIANIIPRDGEMSFEELASAINVNASVLERIFRHAFTFRLFRESKPGYVAHTALSLAVPTLDPWIWLNLGKLQRSAFLGFPESLKLWSEPAKPGLRQIPFNIGMQTDKSFWEIIKTEPDGMQKFSNAMKSLTKTTGLAPSHIVNGFDWKALGKGPVIDIGGGNGHIALTIAKAFPGLELIIQDLTSNKEAAMSAIPQELTDRVSFMSHDFFKPQPIIEEAKAYFFRAIFHDWQDEDCIRIIRPLVPGLEKGARLFIADRVLPSPGAMALQQEKLIRSMDITMFGYFGAKERSLEEWKTVFTGADERLVVATYRQPLGSEHAMLEVVLKHST